MAPSLSSFHFFLEDSASQTTSHPQGDICSLKTMLSVLGLGVLAKKPGLGLVLSGSYAGSLESEAPKGLGSAGRRWRVSAPATLPSHMPVDINFMGLGTERPHAGPLT